MPSETKELIAGRYRKLGTIGVGGMARVVLAEDERLRRRVAIKALHADDGGRLDDSAQRFEREALLGASLNHPNLVSVYDVVTDQEAILIVMEYVEGKTLKEAIAEGPLDPETALSVIADVAAALDHAHKAGIVHRDVKPANILIREDGVAKLADLGIATAAESTRITSSGIVLGTAVYMAPEQLEGDKPGPASDIYSLAAVAYEALSGKKAREGASPVEIAHQAASGPAPDLLGAWPAAPPAAARALARGMSREPEDRQSSAGALAAELERALDDDGPALAAMADRTMPMDRADGPDPVGAPLPRTQRGRRFPSWLPATAAVVILLAIAAVAFASLGGDDSGSTSDNAADRADSGKATKKSKKDDQAEAAPAATPEPAPAEPESSESDAPEASEEVAPESGDPAALNDQGFVLMNEGRYDEAIPLFQQAVDSYPDGSTDLTYAYALYNLGHSLRLAGRPDEAIPVLEARLEIPNQTSTVQRELDAARQAAG